jgi:DNA-binding winged helix-turn-helix (wHTH) protein/Flp pilus assembly protein TadD
MSASDKASDAEVGQDDGRIVAFDGYQFDLEGLTLTRDGRTVRLQPQPSRVLAELIRAGGALVTRKHLREAIWGGRFVEFDQALNFCIRQIRSALADEAETPRFVETLPRRGYRFLAPVQAAARAGGRRSTPARVRWAAGLAGAALVLAGVVWLARPTSEGTTLDDPASPDEVAAKRLSPDTRVAFLASVRWLRARTGEGYRRATSGFASVLASDPDFLPARIGRAEALLWDGRVTEARAALDAILADYPEEARAHTLRGALALFRDWDVPAARRHLLRGAGLAPWSSTANHYVAYYHLIAGDSSAARRSIGRALELDPLSPTLQGDAGLVFYWLRRYQRGRDLCRRSLALAPVSRAAVHCLFLVEAAAGRRDSLLAAARRLAAIDSAPAMVQASLAGDSADLRPYLDWEAERLAGLPDEGPGTALALVRVHLLRGQPETAKIALAAGLRRHSNALVFLRVEPLIDPIRGDTLVQRVQAALYGR